MLKSKLNGENVINAINIWDVATVRYGTGTIKWNKGELDMHRALLLAGYTYQESSGRNAECQRLR